MIKLSSLCIRKMVKNAELKTVETATIGLNYALNVVFITFSTWSTTFELSFIFREKFYSPFTR